MRRRSFFHQQMPAPPARLLAAKARWLVRLITFSNRGFRSNKDFARMSGHGSRVRPGSDANSRDVYYARVIRGLPYGGSSGPPSYWNADFRTCVSRHILPSVSLPELWMRNATRLARG